MPFNILSKKKKSRRNLSFLQNLQHLFGIDRMRPVVEGERRAPDVSRHRIGGGRIYGGGRRAGGSDGRDRSLGQERSCDRCQSQTRTYHIQDIENTIIMFHKHNRHIALYS